VKRRFFDFLAGDLILAAAAVVGVGAVLLLPIAVLVPIAALCIAVLTYAVGYRRSENAYRRQIHRLSGEQERAWETAYEAFEARNGEREWATHDVPPRFTAQHRELGAISATMRAAQRSTGDLGERARSALEDRQRWEELRRAIEVTAETEAEHRYSETLQATRLRRREALAQLAHSGEASLERLISALETIRPPYRLSSAHQSFLDACRETLTAVRASNEANERGDVEDAIDAGHRVTGAWAEMKGLERQVLSRR
jgi:hypothetical protein